MRSLRSRTCFVSGPLTRNKHAMPDSFEPTARSAGDVTHAVAKAAIGSLPFVGAAGVELFSYVVSAPHERRREAWMKQVGDDLAKLRDTRGVNLHTLRDDDSFVDAVVAATQAAIRTADVAKHAALRNAILNTAFPFAPEEAVRQTYIQFIDELNAWHLRFLDLFDDPNEWQRMNDKTFPTLYAGGLSHVVEHAYPEVKSRQNLYDQWWRDLYTRGLVSTDSLHVMMSGHGLLGRRTTDFGREFVKFVREPVAPAR